MPVEISRVLTSGDLYCKRFAGDKGVVVLGWISRLTPGFNPCDFEESLLLETKHVRKMFRESSSDTQMVGVGTHPRV